MATLKDVKRIVIKVGTSTLTHHTGKSNIRQIKKLVAVISDIVNSGVEVALVTSGAIGVGVGKLGLRDRPTNTAGKQAAATIGQCELMFMYDKMFAEFGHTVGQFLITKRDVDNDECRENLINTEQFRLLMKMMQWQLRKLFLVTTTVFQPLLQN